MDRHASRRLTRLVAALLAISSSTVVFLASRGKDGSASNSAAGGQLCLLQSHTTAGIYHERVRAPNFGVDLFNNERTGLSEISVTRDNMRHFNMDLGMGQKRIIFDGGRGEAIPFDSENEEGESHKSSEDDGDTRAAEPTENMHALDKQLRLKMKPGSKAEAYRQREILRKKAQEIRAMWDEMGPSDRSSDMRADKLDPGEWRQVKDDDAGEGGMKALMEQVEKNKTQNSSREGAIVEDESAAGSSAKEESFKIPADMGYQNRDSVLKQMRRAQRFFNDDSNEGGETTEQRETSSPDSSELETPNDAKLMQSMVFPQRCSYEGPRPLDPWEQEHDSEKEKIATLSPKARDEKLQLAESTFNIETPSFDRGHMSMFRNGEPLPYLTAPPTPAPDISAKRTKQGRSRVKLKYLIAAAQKRLEQIDHAANHGNPAMMGEIAHLKAQLKKHKFYFNDEGTSDAEYKHAVSAQKRDADFLDHNVVYEWSGTNMTVEKVTYEHKKESNSDKEEMDSESRKEYVLNRVARFRVGDRIRHVLRGYEHGTIISVRSEGKKMLYSVRMDGDGTYKGEEYAEENHLAPLVEDQRASRKVPLSKEKPKIAFLAKPPPGLIRGPWASQQLLDTGSLETDPKRGMTYLENKETNERYGMPRVLNPNEAGFRNPTLLQTGYRYIPPAPKQMEPPVWKPSKFSESKKAVSGSRGSQPDEKKPSPQDLNFIPEHRKEAFHRQFQQQKSLEVRARQNAAIEKRLGERMHRPQFKYRLSKKKESDKVKGPYMPKQK